MKKAIGTLLSIACLAVPARVQAQTNQTETIFLDVNVGGQMLSPTLDAATSFSLFGERGSIATKQPIAAGVLADARLGYRASPRWAFALAVSGFRNSSEGQGTAFVPSPIFVASPSVTTLSSAELTRREIGYHVEALWSLSQTDTLDISVFGGPSFVHLRQSLMTVTASSTGAQTVSAGATDQTGNAIGANAGVEAVRHLSSRFGVAVFGRYVFAQVDLPSATGVEVGGLQAGGGLRIKF